MSHDVEHGTSAMEALYPFLYSDASDLADLMAEIRESTLAKTREIADLRSVVAARESTRLANCAEDMAARFAAGGRLFAFGNGGSATDAQELATLFLAPGGDAPSLPAFGLANDTSVVTALCNDVGVEVVFARQLAAFGRREDIAVGLSTSGNSENLVRAFAEASLARDAHRGAGRLRGRGHGRAGQHRLPVRRAVHLGAPDPGSPDHHLPRAVGAHDRRPGPPPAKHVTGPGGI